MDFSEGKPTIPNLQGRLLECIDKCKVIQFYSEPQPGCSPKVPEGTKLSRITCSVFPAKRYFSSMRFAVFWGEV